MAAVEETIVLFIAAAVVAFHEDGFQRVRVKARVEHFGGQRHGRGRKELDLFQMIAHRACLFRERLHILQAAVRMRRDEIRNQLLAQALAAAHLVKEPLEAHELFERHLAHRLQYGGLGMFGRHLEPSGHAFTYNGFSVIRCTTLVCIDKRHD